MFEKRKIYCSEKVPLTNEELRLIDRYFEVKSLKRKVPESTEKEARLIPAGSSKIHC